MSDATKKAARRYRGRARSWARRYAMQALYQWQLAGHDLHVIDAQFLEDQDMGKADQDYFRELLHRVPAHLEIINSVLVPYLERPLEQVDPVEKAVLWIAAYELLKRPDIPYRVVINEAVELSKLFGADQGHRFVNGVLDKTAQTVRPEETGRR